MRTLLAVVRPYRVPLRTAALLAFVLTCKDVTVTPVAVRNVAVTPTDTTLTVGDELTLTAVVTDVAGNRLNDRAVTWSSEDDAVVSVSAAGGVVAVASGEADVTAAVDGRSGTATIHVMDAEEEVARVEVDPDTTSIAVGATVDLEAIARSESGTVLEGRDVSWSSSDDGVATVDGEGVVTGASAGEATITAAIDGIEDAAAVTVTEVVEPVETVEVEPADTSIVVGETVAMKAIVRSEEGAVLGGRDVSWSSDDEAVATVDAEGVVTGVAAGEATIMATVEGVSGNADVTVSIVSVDRVVVDPAVPSILVGDTVRLEATALTADGDTLADRAASWESGDDAVATVDDEGLVTGVANGAAEITATVDGISGSTNVTVSLVPVVSVEIVPAEPSILVGDTVRLQTIALAANGDTLAGRMVAWSSDETAVATVDAQGLVTGIGAGDARINATIENASASATVTVSLVPVASVEIVPADTSLFVGQTVQLAAIARSADGDALEGRDVDWDSRDDDVATVDDDLGLVTAVAVGTARIEAEIEDEEGTATVTVSPVPVANVVIEPPESDIVIGGTAQLEATALDADGDPLEGREVEAWTSSNEAAATVSPQGLVTGVAEGTATITATIEGEDGTAEVTVSAVPVASVVIEPAESDIVIGGTVQLVATALDADGDSLEGRDVEAWTSSNEAAATVDPQGLVTGVAEGTATITATIEGEDGTAEVTVSLAPVDSVVVEPADTSIFLGETVQLNAVALAENGDTLVGRAISWASDNQLVATVDDGGLVSAAVLPGDATITATIEGIRDSANVTVSLIPVGSVEVDPPESNIFVAETVQLVATALDTNGDPLDGREVDAWTTDNQAVATVDVQGLVTGVGAGAAAIMAMIEDVLGTATVTVSLVPVGHVVIAPAESSIFVDETVQLVATALDADGEPLDDREIQAWTSDDEAVASVDQQGLVTGVAVGDVTITATIEDVPGTAEVTVSLVPVNSVAVEPAESSILVGGTVQLVATALDAHGEPIEGREVEAWTSDNALVATVDANGLVRGGLLPGNAAITATIDGVPGTANVTVRLISAGTVEAERAEANDQNAVAAVVMKRWSSATSSTAAITRDNTRWCPLDCGDGNHLPNGGGKVGCSKIVASIL